jgi:hypothetical protein
MSGSCELCRAPKSVRACEECGRDTCKNCLVHLAPEALAFHPDPPPFAKKSAFCVDCHEALVAPELAHYAEVLERSREITLVRPNYRGHLPVTKKAKNPTEVKDEIDRDEAVAHLCFLAAWEGFDAIIQFGTESRKLRHFGWEKKNWSASGLFVCLDYKRFRPQED